MAKKKNQEIHMSSQKENLPKNIIFLALGYEKSWVFVTLNLECTLN